MSAVETPSTMAPATLAELMSVWRARDVEDWSRSPGTYRTLAEKILGQGEPLLAYDVVSEALAKWPEDIRLRQLQGLALARSGATERANAILETLRSAGQTDEETLGMLGRTYKDLASRTGAEREKFLRRAAEIYTQAYESSGGYWSGINAATMNLLIGETERAAELAEKVRAECLQALSPDQSGDQYWLLAALGEAALILPRLGGSGKMVCARSERRGAPLRRSSLQPAQRALDLATLEDGPGQDRPIPSRSASNRFRRSHDRSAGSQPRRDFHQNSSPPWRKRFETRSTS